MIGKVLLLFAPFLSFGCNVQWVLDESGSVDAQNYYDSIEFVKQLIDEEVQNISPISVYSFSTMVDEIYRFNQPQLPRIGVQTALDDAKFSRQDGCTDTIAALDVALTEYERANTAGDLVDKGDNLLFLLTDGVPTCDCADSARRCRTDVCGPSGRSIRDRINNLGIRVITLGIGNFDISRIQCLSDNADVFQVEDFSAREFQQLATYARPILDSCPSGNPTALPTSEPTSVPTTSCVQQCNLGLCRPMPMAKSNPFGQYDHYGVHGDDEFKSAIYEFMRSQKEWNEYSDNIMYTFIILNLSAIIAMIYGCLSYRKLLINHHGIKGYNVARQDTEDEYHE